MTLPARRPDPDTLRLLDYLSAHCAFSQKETTVVGLIAQHRRLSTTALSQALQLRQKERTCSWVGQLIEKEVVLAQGVTKGMYYTLNPSLYAAVRLDVRPTLRTLEPHRLRALIVEDVRTYPESASADIIRRIGPDVVPSVIERAIYDLVQTSELMPIGGQRNRRYSAAKKTDK